MVISNLFDDLERSDAWAQKRIEKAAAVLGHNVVARFLAFAQHLLGFRSDDIARSIGLPVDTLNGLFKRIYREGLPALEDRRHRASAFLPMLTHRDEPECVALAVEAEHICLAIGSRTLRLARSDSLLCRTVLLSLLDSGWLPAGETATALGLSVEHLRKLTTRLARDGAASLIDHRQGQTQDYRMLPETKAELIRQYVLNLETGRPVSGPCLKRDIQARGKACPSARTVTVHIKKLGLDRLGALDDDGALKKGPHK